MGYDYKIPEGRRERRREARFFYWTIDRMEQDGRLPEEYADLLRDLIEEHVEPDQGSRDHRGHDPGAYKR